jgi:hypothetical protein
MHTSNWQVTNCLPVRKKMVCLLAATWMLLGVFFPCVTGALSWFPISVQGMLATNGVHLVDW